MNLFREDSLVRWSGNVKRPGSFIVIDPQTREEVGVIELSVKNKTGLSAAQVEKRLKHDCGCGGAKK